MNAKMCIKVPDWIKHFRHEGYSNAFDLFPGNTSLYATETLFGDWGGASLLLAKDAAPTEVMKSIGSWRHAQRVLGDRGGWRTNERLERLASMVPGGKLYGSATANMLFDRPGWSRPLKDFSRGRLNDYLCEVLKWVVLSMPNVKGIACLGQESWSLVTKVMGLPELASDWVSHRKNIKPVVGDICNKKIIAMPLFHPAARVSDKAMAAGWTKYADIIKWQVMAVRPESDAPPIIASVSD